jgi:poly(3-hydroxyalkanoate) synthetase
MTMMTAAYLAGTGDDCIGPITLLNTLLDFSGPGALDSFTDEATVAKLKKMAPKRATWTAGTWREPSICSGRMT